MAAGIGTLKERHLHASLKALLVEPGDLTEAAVDGYIVDILRGGAGGSLIIEVHTGNFATIARKMRALVAAHRVRLVYPIPRVVWLMKLPPEGGAPSRRKSPLRGAVVDVFDKLVSIPDLMGHENFEVEVVLTEEEKVQRHEPGKRWRQRGWVTEERRLLEVHERVLLCSSADYVGLLPAGLGAEFTTAELAAGLGCKRGLAQKMAYCLRKRGLVEQVGTAGRAAVYGVAGG